MRDKTEAQAMRGRRLFTFGSGGWVIVLAVIIMIMVAVITMLPQIRAARDRPPGDGRNPETYGFDLATLAVSEEQLAAGLLHRDRVEALVQPEVIPASDVPLMNEQRRGKFIVSTDRVIGVVVNGEARAYPTRILNIHEAVNDVLGGKPILVTYNPLCDSAAAYDRSNPDGDAPFEFGLSGLMWQSHPLLYDRGAAPGNERLWSQLLGAAVTDPLGQGDWELERIPADLTHWSDWRRRHPETTVLIEPKENELDLYKYVDYSEYRMTDDLRFPVSPLPSDGKDWSLKTPCIVLTGGPNGEGARLYSVLELLDAASASGRVATTVGGVEYVFRAFADPPAAIFMEAIDVETGEPVDAQPLPVYAYWFAWHAVDPDVAVGAVEEDADAGSGRAEEADTAFEREREHTFGQAEAGA